MDCSLLKTYFFRFSLKNKRDNFNKCSVVISLTQKLRFRKEEKSIGFRVYKLSEEDNKEPLLGPRFIDDARNVVKTSGDFINSREVITFFSSTLCEIPLH